jgi:hypothetical protein
LSTKPARATAVARERPEIVEMQDFASLPAFEFTSVGGCLREHFLRIACAMALFWFDFTGID